MTAAYFADLDSTTIFTSRHFAGRVGEYNGLVVVDTYNEAPLSFMTYEAVQKLQDISRHLVFVPTTTRDLAQFQRVSIPGTRSKYAIIANGGRILVDGVEDLAWSAHIQTLVSASVRGRDLLALLKTELRDEEWVKIVRLCTDLFVYIVALPGFNPPAWFNARVTELALASGYTVSVQGRTTYLLPHGLTKEAAAAEVATRVAPDMTLAAGDSLLDVGLMKFADYGIRPGHGELDLHETGLRRTASSGIAAGLEILDYVAAVSGLPGHS